MEGAVYLLCAATALACGWLLLRGYWRTRVRLLLWCGLFFLVLFVENGILFIDVELIPEFDLSPFRNALAVAGMIVLLYGLVWDTK